MIQQRHNVGRKYDGLMGANDSKYDGLGALMTLSNNGGLGALMTLIWWTRDANDSKYEGLGALMNLSMMDSGR